MSNPQTLSTLMDQLRDACAIFDRHAAWNEGPVVTASFDHPGIARAARAYLQALRGGNGSPFEPGDRVQFWIGTSLELGNVCAPKPQDLLDGQIRVEFSPGGKRRILPLHPIRLRRFP